MNIGLQSYTGAWSTYVTNLGNGCTSNAACGYYNAAIDYGFSCRAGNQLYRHYNNNEVYSYEESVGGYYGKTLAIEFEGNEVNWLVDGVSIATETETSINYPLYLIAGIHEADASCAAVDNLEWV